MTMYGIRRAGGRWVHRSGRPVSAGLGRVLEAERKLPAVTAAAGVDWHQARAMRTVALRRAFVGDPPAAVGVVEAVLGGLPASAARRRPVVAASAEMRRHAGRRLAAVAEQRRADAVRLGRLAAVTGRVVDELGALLARAEAGWEAYRQARGRAAGLGPRDRSW